MWKILTAASTALVLIASPALAEWDQWDANDDAVVDESEFAAGFGEEGVYGEWDEDGDGALSEDEFNAGVYGMYDEDDSGDWNEEEYNDYEEEDDWF